MSPRSRAPLTVVITSYNRERYLGPSIESALASTFEDFEILVLDDASSDRSTEIALSHAERDPRIRLVVNERNLGDYGNRNRAIELVETPYLKFHDSDDILYRHCLEIMMRLLEAEPDAGFALTSGRAWPGGPCPMPADASNGLRARVPWRWSLPLRTLGRSLSYRGSARDGRLPRARGSFRLPFLARGLCESERSSRAGRLVLVSDAPWPDHPGRCGREGVRVGPGRILEGARVLRMSSHGRGPGTRAAKRHPPAPEADLEGCSTRKVVPHRSSSSLIGDPTERLATVSPAQGTRGSDIDSWV